MGTVDNVVHGLSLATIRGRWLGKTPFVQVSTAWALTCPKTVHQRPCMMRELKTWLSDSRVGNSSVVDHRSRRPVLSPQRNCVDRCHVCPYWASRCKPLRCMLRHQRTVGQFGWASMIWSQYIHAVPACAFCWELSSEIVGCCWQYTLSWHLVSHTGLWCSVVVSGVCRMNEVNAHRARLVPGWVTIFGWVYNLGM